MPLDVRAFASAAESVRQHCRVPGMAVGIVRPGRPDYLDALGFADIEIAAPCTPATRFSIASVTKTYTAALALVLQAEGRLSLDDPLSLHLPAFGRSAERCGASPTLRDALSHRSGFSGYEELWYNSPWSRREILYRLGRGVPSSSPGRRFAYSNLMFVAAGEAAAQAAGMPYEGALQSRLLSPRGDLHTGATGFLAPASARPYRTMPSGQWQRVPSINTNTAFPAVGLQASAASLLNWMKLLLRGGNQILGPAAIAQMWTPHSDIQREDDPRIHGYFGQTSNLQYGLGWFLGQHNGLKTVSHTGALPGFRCHVALVPGEGIGVAVLANLNQTLAPEIFIYQMLDLLTGGRSVDWFEHFDGVRRDRESQQTETATLTADIPTAHPLPDHGAQYVAFEHEVFGRFCAWRAGGTLRFSWANYLGELIPCPGGTYRIGGVDCPLLGDSQSVEFLLAPDGRLRGLRFLGHELQRVEPAPAGKKATTQFACV